MPGMDTVGARMKAGQCFIPEVLLSARTMQACLELIKPQLAAGDAPSAARSSSAPSRATCTTSARTSWR